MTGTRRQRERRVHVVATIAALVVALLVLGVGTTVGASTPFGFETTRHVGLLDVVTIHEVAPAAGAPPFRRDVTADPVAIAISALLVALPFALARAIAIPVVRARRLPDERCDECGYEVGVPIDDAPRCPECGEARARDAVHEHRAVAWLARAGGLVAHVAAVVAIAWLLAALWSPSTVMRGTMDGELLTETTRWGLLGWRIDRFTATPPTPAPPPSTIATVPLVATIAITVVIVIGIVAAGARWVRRRRIAGTRDQSRVGRTAG